MACDNDSDYADPEPVTDPPLWATGLVTQARQFCGHEVYPPSDDTFLLLEALASDGPRLRALRPRVCLEIGCGSGTVSAGLLEVLDGKAGSESSTDHTPLVPPLLLSIDKNPQAVHSASSLLKARGSARSDVIRASLTGNLRVAGGIEVIICNPPYVPTPSEEMEGCGISVSWAGGDRGREVIDVLLPQVVGLMAPGGLFYLVCLAENEPEELLHLMRSKGLEASIAKHEQRGMEELFILRFHRPVV